MKISRSTKWVSDTMLNTLLREYEASTELSKGGLSYRRHDFWELYEILPDAFAVSPMIRRSEAIGLFSKALRECRRAGTMNSEAIIKHAAAIQKKALAVPQESYTLWTKFRARDMAHSKGFTLAWRGVKLRTAAYLPAWLQREEYFLNGVGRIFPRKPDFYGHVILACDDRNEDRAVDRMMDALQLMHGLLNLYETLGRHSGWSGRNWTEGKLWLGPTQFLFRDRKFRGEDRIWYNPDYDEEAWARLPPSMKRILQVVPMARTALAALDKHPLCDVLVRAIILLQDGFATRDSNHRLLRYWSALEQLYVEPDAKGRSNDKVLERAVFAELKPELSKWKLEHIARLRNDYVHAGGSNDDLHHMCQFLRELLGRHINHWIFRGGDFANHSALLQLVKLPSDRAALVQMQEMITRRLAYLDT
ncbi:hypothetical protein ABGN05_12450 [Aquibium sp. LZ166]|uniref:Apea-like HEPN domain-containing protein n=1 Tax=Aquibium pacificus TaxID=3153579 RepID=A0ABV3SKF3_9HYPH